MPSPLWTIGLGTLSISVTSAAITGAYSILKNKPNPGVLISGAAINSGATAAIFFTWREYVVSPFLIRIAPGEQYSRRRQEFGLDPLPSDEPVSSQQLTWSNLRPNKLLDSGLSGAITGGVLRGMRTGRRAILPGAITVGAACTLLQYGFNEVSLSRLRYISKHNEENKPVLEKPPIGTMRETHNDLPTPSALQSLLRMVGFSPISDEEALTKMKKSREIYLKRIAELEREINEKAVLQEMNPKTS